MGSAIADQGQLPSLCRELVRTLAKGTVIGLQGVLGAGKTTFVKEFVAALGKKQSLARVTSPTFIFHQRYETVPAVDHWDLYRMENATRVEVEQIGYFDVLNRAREEKGFVFVEWPEHAGFQTLELDMVIRIETHPQGRIYYWQRLAGLAPSK